MIEDGFMVEVDEIVNAVEVNSIAELTFDSIKERGAGQYSFDPLFFQEEYQLPLDQATKLALNIRNLTKSKLIKAGLICKGFCLTGQLKKYKSFGISDGRVRTVYYLSVKESSKVAQ